MTFRADDPNANAIGGTTYFGGSLEVQFPIFGLPRELGLKGAVFADAGTLFGYEGPTHFDINGNGSSTALAPTALRAAELDAAAGMHRGPRQQDIRSSVGAIHPVDFAARSDPLRLRLCPDEG